MKTKLTLEFEHGEMEKNQAEQIGTKSVPSNFLWN